MASNRAPRSQMTFIGLRPSLFTAAGVYRTQSRQERTDNPVQPEAFRFLTSPSVPAGGLGNIPNGPSSAATTGPASPSAGTASSVVPNQAPAWSPIRLPQALQDQGQRPISSSFVL